MLLQVRPEQHADAVLHGCPSDGHDGPVAQLPVVWPEGT